jgi:hypothetical protein
MIYLSGGAQWKTIASRATGPMRTARTSSPESLSKSGHFPTLLWCARRLRTSRRSAAHCFTGAGRGTPRPSRCAGPKHASASGLLP